MTFQIPGASTAAITPTGADAHLQAGVSDRVTQGAKSALAAPKEVQAQGDQTAQVYTDLGRLGNAIRNEPYNSPGIARYATDIQGQIGRLSSKIEANETRLQYYTSGAAGRPEDLAPEARQQLRFEENALRQQIATDRSELNKLVQEGKALLNRHSGVLQ